MLCRCQGIDHQNTQRGRVIKKNVVKIVPELGKCPGDNQAHAFNAHHSALQGCERCARWQQGEPGRAGVCNKLSRKPLWYLALMLKQIKNTVCECVWVIPKPTG